MNAMPDAQLCHIGLYAFDLEKMVDFYSRIFGLVVTDRGHSARGFDIAFLSRDPIEHHQIAIASGRPKDAVHTTINQISFRVAGPRRAPAILSLAGQGARQEARPAQPRQRLEHLFRRSRGQPRRALLLVALARQPAVRRAARSDRVRRHDPRQDRGHGQAGPDLPADGVVGRADEKENERADDAGLIAASSRRRHMRPLSAPSAPAGRRSPGCGWWRRRRSSAAAGSG